jgi:signal transduction histidine kinase/DNA-binding response OmpR family regulator/HPt (histidine-containing phosphotransfer) domain-containing protein
MLPLWIGALISVQRVMHERLERMASDSFSGIKHGLEGAQKERIARMRQATRLVVSIPELRALIAEHNYELNADNGNSLQERLDTISSLVGASFVAVLDRRQVLIAQSKNPAWASLAELNDYRNRAAEPAALIRSVFTRDGAQQNDFGLWVTGGRLYQVIGTPLVFNGAADGSTEPDGALIMGIQITDRLALELGRSHNAQLTFLSGGAIVASSMPLQERENLMSQLSRKSAPASDLFRIQLGQTIYHASAERLADPCSGNTVGTVLIQCDLQDGQTKAEVLRRLTMIMVTGLVAAMVVSFVLSSRITKPVQELVAGAAKVAQGELDLSLKVRGKDEMAQLARSFNDMVAQIRARRQLERMVEDAQAASRAKSQFLANVSHEIRTPLNGVVGMIDLLLGTPLVEQQRRYAGLAKTSAELLTTLISDILDFSKIEAGKLELENIEFNLALTAEGVMELLADRAARKGLEIACHIHADVPTHVRGDPDRLRQILVNLVSNAIKFTEKGSVIIRVLPQPPASIGAVTVRFSVTDTGIGIARERRDRLFKPFSQVDASTTRKFGGTGLGLAISKQLAELMGGSIGVESEPGRGSTFWFVANLERGNPQLAARPAMNPRGLRVLVVSDNETTRMILQEQLASWKIQGHTGRQCDALSLLRDAARGGAAFDVAIIDSDATGAAGSALVCAIRQEQPAVKTVLMALLPMDARADKALLKAVGFAGYLSKPVRQSYLFDALMNAIAGNDAPADPAMVELPTARIGATGRILVAEDNEVNQIVARELLERAGYVCDIVDSGRKAVEAATTQAYDAILMDCQMPELDGFQATKAIREHEAKTGAHIPIIALTANAVKGDREECLAAGMDEYCTKPIDPRHLFSLIESLLRRRSMPIPAAVAAAAAAAAAGAVDAGGESTPAAAAVAAAHAAAVDALSLPMDLNVLLSRCMNSEATVTAVLAKFEKQLAHDLPELTRSLAAADVDSAARTAHSLKGAASMVTASDVADIAGSLERLARDRQLGQTEEHLARLREEIQRCTDYLKSARTTKPESPAPRAQTEK